MENFIYSIPTTVYFGKGKLASLGSELKKYGNRVLLVYGQGSIKKNGCYQEILSQCKEHDICIWELGGVLSNPDIQTVLEGAQICKDEKIEIVLAAGGGSVLDCGKIIAAAATSSVEPWELVMHPEKISNVLPIVVVSTAAASGSEMDYTAVISNRARKGKIACGCKQLLPKAAFLDPTYSISLGKKETAEGIADILSHLIEIYFSDTRAFLQERFNEAVFRTCIHCGMILKEDPGDYEARANLMWSACWAMNGFLRWGKPGGWTCHVIAHELGAMYPELSHGQILAALLPNWLKVVIETGKRTQLREWAINVWDIRENNSAIEEKAIEALENFFQMIGLSHYLNLKISSQDILQLSERIEQQLQNPYVRLTKEDISNILTSVIVKQT